LEKDEKIENLKNKLNQMKIEASKTVSNRTEFESTNIRINLNFSNIDNQDMTLSRAS
jgi:predicted component of type VI protein secretion system